MAGFFIMITANVATIPSRVHAFRDCVHSILPQVDMLYVYLNGFDTVPAYLKGNPKIKFYRSQDHFGNIGDIGKFFNCHLWDGYVFTIDDKFIYPSDYTQRHVQNIEKYDRKAVVSFHGRNLHTSRPTKSYYNDPKDFFSCLSTVPADIFVHELGTGVMAFHTDTYQPSLDIFRHTNMTDIYLSIDLLEKKIPRLLASHKEGWIRVTPNFDRRISISMQWNTRDKVHTEIINQHTWEIHKP